MTDRIRIHGIEVFAHHGVLPHETELGQPFVVDVELRLDLSQAAAGDDLEDTVDYGSLARRVHDRVASERWDLIERVAGRVADVVLEDPRVIETEVTVTKPKAPFPVPVGSVSVTLTRRR
ncbi:MAG: dihydroneopterin aldolase [Acidimicrobiia bacterium]